MASQIEIQYPNKTIFYDCYKSFSIDIEYPCSSDTFCSEIAIKFPKGIYFLEAWGSQGQDLSTRGGYGGYSCGVFKTIQETYLYLHVGSFVSTELNYGYNGGGKGSSLNYDGNGGGATDFRTKSGNWNENLPSRILVAGGGGGAYSSSSPGGDGGGTEGTSGSETTYGNESPHGTQTGCSGGKGDIRIVNSNQGYSEYYGAGGGGFYGGGSADYCGGGGGSGYCGLNTTYKSYRGNTIVSDHKGKGKAKITVLLYGEECYKTCLCNNYIRIIINLLYTTIMLDS